MTSIILPNNIIVYISKSERYNDKIDFKIKDSHNRYFEETCEFKSIQDIFDKNITQEEFFQYLENNPPSILEKKEENEMILKITAKRTLILVLKLANVNINNTTIKMKNYQGINNEISQNENSLANNHSEVSNCLNLDIGNNQSITISKSDMRNDHINIIYFNKNTKQIYKTNYEPDEINEFYNYIKGKNISIENGDNENEKKLKIEYEGKKMLIILKEILLINKEEINTLKKKYEEKMKHLKEININLNKRNKELKEKIEEEKRKNDENVRIYLENRVKYEEALKKNEEINKLSVNIE